MSCVCDGVGGKSPDVMGLAMARNMFIKTVT